jgi:hypothetical protein
MTWNVAVGVRVSWPPLLVTIPIRFPAVSLTSTDQSSFAELLTMRGQGSMSAPPDVR